MKDLYLSLGSNLGIKCANPVQKFLLPVQKAHARQIVNHSIQTRAQKGSKADDGGVAASDGAEPPWSIGSYFSKKKRRKLGKDGKFVLEFDDYHHPVGWETGGKIELAVRIVADETGTDALTVREKVAELSALLPGVCDLLKPAEVARLSLQTSYIADMVITLRQELPNANLSVVFGKLAKVLLREGGVDAIISTAKSVKKALQVDNIDALVDREPLILQPGLVPNALIEMERILPPGTDVAKVLVRRPEMLLTVQNLSNVDRGDRDEYYIAEMRNA